MRLPANRRPAFTLIELIVVLGIIALLATISVAGVMRVQKAQREINSDRTLRAVQIGLDQQWKAAVNRAGSENPHDFIIQLTSNGGVPDQTRAKALHMMLRLRQEFPQNYAEANYNAFPGVPPAVRPSFLAMYGPKLVYQAAIGPGNGTPTDEAAALLIVTLSQSRDGVAFNVREAGPVQTIDVGGKQMPVLVDAWGSPICLRRWATDAEPAAVAELNQAPFVTQAMINSGNRNYADQDGKLRQAWAGKPVAMSWFVTPLPQVADPFDGNNRGPFVLSAGQDKTYVTPDDLFSFRLQQAGKGN
jgi:prepilin-type N-terminal cleavage/methylation domain-containing protein